MSAPATTTSNTDIFMDNMGEDGNPTTSGPKPSDEHGFLINDPDYYLIDDPTRPSDGKTWNSAKLALQLAELDPEIKTCEMNCREAEALRKKKCDIVRKRVSEALKKAGCPSKITPYAKPKRTCKK